MLCSSENKHVAIKILKGYATQLNREQKLRELDILQRLSSSVIPRSQGPDHCVRFENHFFLPGIEYDGEYLCLVMELFNSNVQDILASLSLKREHIPIPIVKRILRHLLLGIARLHEHGIAHTGMFLFLLYRPL